MTSQTYFGVQICSAWPAAALRPGNKRPDYERWEAWMPSGESVAGWSLPEIKALIKEARALGTSQPPGRAAHQSNAVTAC